MAKKGGAKKEGIGSTACLGTMLYTSWRDRGTTSETKKMNRG